MCSSDLSHATEDCYDLKRLREARERQQGRGGRGGRRWNNNNYNDNYQKNPQANAAQPANDNLPAETPEGYQVPRGAACILGGAQAPSSNRHFKQLAREASERDIARPSPEPPLLFAYWL